MQLPSTVDIVVVGAGIIGASVAWHLSQGGRDVLLLEQGDQPGAEASAQNAGMVRRLAGHEVERYLAIRTHRFLEDPPDGFERDELSRRTGAVLGFAQVLGQLDAAVVDLRRAGVEVETSLRVPEAAPAMAGCPLLWAWYLPDERQADPHALVSSFVRGLRRGGGRLACGVRVLGFEAEGDRVRGVTTTAGRVSCDRVVIAAGAWSGRLGRSAGLDRRLVPLSRALLHSEPTPHSRPDHPWCWVDDVGVYIKPEAGGWLVSACEEAVAEPAEGPGSTGPVDPLSRAMVLDKAARMFPALGELRFRGGWTGLRTFAPDRRPHLGADPAIDGLWWATGFGGSGVTCCAAAGEALATWMGGGETPWLDRTEVDPGRPLPTVEAFCESTWIDGARPRVNTPDAIDRDPLSTAARRPHGAVGGGGGGGHRGAGRTVR